MSLSELDDANGLSNVTLKYDWFADSTKIAGATGSFYTPAANVGKTIRVRVRFTAAAGNEESLISVATGTIAP